MFSDPIQNLKVFGLEEDMIVADLGAGSGFYSIAVAKMVPKGKVYAIEVIPDFIKSLRNKIKDENLQNIECILGNVEKIGGTKLKEHIIDRIIASNIFFQIEDKSLFLEELKRILKPHGRILLIDWSKEESSMGKNLANAVSSQETRAMFEKKGFIHERDIDAGPHHYGMIYRK